MRRILTWATAISVLGLLACAPSAEEPRGTVAQVEPPENPNEEEIPPPIQSDSPAEQTPATEDPADVADPAEENDMPATDTLASSDADAGPHLFEPEPPPDTVAAATPAAVELRATPEQCPDYLQGVPLIPRQVFFGNPDKAQARLSPDGRRLSFLAPVDGVLNVWVGPVDDLTAAQPVTHDALRGIRSYFWAYTNEHIVYLQDAGGNEDWRVFCVSLASGDDRDLTPLDPNAEPQPGVTAQIEAVSYRTPQEIIIGLNQRTPEFHDLYRVNLETGASEVLQENTEGYSGFVLDEDYNVRFGLRYAEDGQELVFQRGDDGSWTEYLAIPPEDTLTTSPAGFDKTGQTLYLLDSRGRDTAALFSIDLATNEQKLIAENDLADISGALSHPTENTIYAVSFTYERETWQVLDPAIQADFDALARIDAGEVQVVSQTLDDQTWVVAYLQDAGPVRYHVYDRATKTARFLFANRDDLAGLPLVPMHPVVIPARDGLKLVSYLTLPPGTDSDGDGRPEQPVPLVLNVHGGPWSRDNWGFDPEHQLLANRGYAVLSVNFRGSTGLGKEFLNAGNGEWAGKMQDDLLDAVAWAIEQQIAPADRIAIMGGSYGGYATLVGLTMTPETFACGVDIVGPSNILTLVATVPPYWKPVMQMFKDRVGDFTTEEGQAMLTERSPLTYADRIVRPLLIGQGANDPRVKQAESDQIVQAMREKSIPVTYVLYPDEGHGFARPANRLSFYAVTEAFLAEHLGGRYEPVGEGFAGSTISAPAGAEYVPGLPAALAELPAVEEVPAEEEAPPAAE